MFVMLRAMWPGIDNIRMFFLNRTSQPLVDAIRLQQMVSQIPQELRLRRCWPSFCSG